jgi:predicted phosphodiesterase
MGTSRTNICVIGDTHGHLQLALCVAARWQLELRISFEAVLICGDVGSFTEDAQLDSTTRRHGKANPCELEFLTQWSTTPPAPWLSAIFNATADGGLGLTCPVIMVHGNHEGFTHLARLVPNAKPAEPVPPVELPTVDMGGHLRLLPSGWRTKFESGCVVAGVGGIEEGQRFAKYHDMAYLDHDAVLSLMDKHVDLLITHQGPSGVQAEKGSENLQVLLDHEIAQVWCHGHSIVNPEVVCSGPHARTTVVPLEDIAFPGKGQNADEPGAHGWCVLAINDGRVDVMRKTPSFLREFRRHRWCKTADGLLIAPPLADLGWPGKK